MQSCKETKRIHKYSAIARQKYSQNQKYSENTKNVKIHLLFTERFLNDNKTRYEIEKSWKIIKHN